MKYITICFFIICAMQISAQPSYASTTIGLPVSDLSQSIEWYSQLLGDVEYFAPADGIVEFMLNDKTWLQLFEGELSPGSVLRLEVTDIQRQHSRLKKLGLSPTPIELVPNVVSFFDFKDLDGNQLSFYKMELP